MTTGLTAAHATPAADLRALIAVDLGAESCRVSLLRWRGGRPHVSLVHRFGNAPRMIDGGLHWNLKNIEEGLDLGLRLCAEIATEGIRSIAVDGWAVDYVRVDAEGKPLADPFCYRDERTLDAERSLHASISIERMREITGNQIMRINTLYQMHADKLAGAPGGSGWMNLPEYILARWGGERVAEYTNATHTQMVELETRRWSPEIAEAAGIEIDLAPKLVSPGTVVGTLSGELAHLAPFADTVLIAPACHDTASAIAGIPAAGDDWAYISSGTWSLVGTLLERPSNGPDAAAENFTNLGAGGNRVCFHKNVNGMWLIRQSIEFWSEHGHTWLVPDLVAAAERQPDPPMLINVDEPDLLLPEDMPRRINAQLVRRGGVALDESPENAPAFANLIFHSLAARYAEVLSRISSLSGKHFTRLFIVGGASQNMYLNRLTEQATGLQVIRGAAESSTLGNFAVQLAALEGGPSAEGGVSAEQVAEWAASLDESRVADTISDAA